MPLSNKQEYWATNEISYIPFIETHLQEIDLIKFLDIIFEKKKHHPTIKV